MKFKRRKKNVMSISLTVIKIHTISIIYMIESMRKQILDDYTNFRSPFFDKVMDY